MKVANTSLTEIDLTNYGFNKVGFGTWVHSDFRIAV